MRKIGKIFFWLASIAFLIGCLALSAFVYYLETSIDKVMSKEKQEQFFSSVDNSPELPDSFYQAVQKYNPGYFEQGVWGSIWDQVSGKRRNGCQCREIYIHPGYTDNWSAFTPEIIALELEERFSQKKCFEFNMSVTDFAPGITGVHKAADFFYKKDISELTNSEIIELVTIWKAPSLYNPFRNRKRLDEAVDRVMSESYGQQ